MSTELTYISALPTSTHQYSILWLHGLGADGHDFEGIVPDLHFSCADQTHFIFPHAHEQAVTINGGAVMPAWYDILGLETDSPIDFQGINKSLVLVEQLIQQELDKGIAAEHIVLAGFSQGGVMALYTGLRYPKPLGGIIALSAYLPGVENLKNEGTAANAATPIFMGHGILDGVVAIEWAKAVYDSLDALGYTVSWHDYLMEHSVSMEEIQHIAQFLDTIWVTEES